MTRHTRVMGWAVAGVGVLLVVTALFGAVADGEEVLVDTVERAFPVVTGGGLVAFNLWLRRRRTPPRDIAFVALGSVVAGTLFALFELWALFVLSFEAPVPDDIDFFLLSAGGLGAAVGSVLTYQYRRLQHERDTLTWLTDDLRRTNGELHDKLERLDEFARVASHDLRNPLNVAEGHLTLARQTGRDEHFEAASNALSRAETITTELLELAREGRTVDDPAPVALDEVARQAWSTVDTRDVTLEATTGVTVEADRNRLRQLFENLFRNAVEHGGEAVTTVRVDTDGPDRFVVADDGVGIGPEAAETLFSLGYTTRSGGTGYGLAIVRSIAEAHGWTVAATTDPRGGARFAVDGVAFLDRTDTDAAETSAETPTR